MRKIAHFGAWFGEKLEVFGSSFLDARFRSSGTFREEIAGDEGEHFIDEALLFAR